MTSNLSFCLVVPAYNEERGIERCVRTLCNALQGFPMRTALIVVDDGSTDQTGNVLRRLADDCPALDIVDRTGNGGYGAAIQRGIQRAAEREFDYALFMDSDLTNDPAYIPVFVEQMRLGTDVIKASRYVEGGRAEGVPAYRVAISVVGNALARWMYRMPLRDCTNGYQAIKVELLKKMPLQESGFAIIMEQLYYAKHLASSVAEVPYTLTARTDHLRKSSFYYRPRAFYQYLKYPVKALLGIPPRKTPAVLPLST